MRLYEVCLSLTADSGTEEEAELLLALGRCQQVAGEMRARWRSAMRAIGIYKQTGNAAGQARATLQALQGNIPPDNARTLLSEALAALDDSEPRLRVELLMRPGRGREGLEQAERLASEHGFGDLIRRISLQRSAFAVARTEIDEAWELGQAAFKQYEADGAHVMAVNALWDIVDLPASQGFLEAGRAPMETMLDLARRRGNHIAIQNMTCMLAGMALAHCDYERFDSLAEVPGESHYVGLLMAARTEQSGETSSAPQQLPPVSSAARVPALLGHVHGGRARTLFNAGQNEAAQEEMAAWRAATEQVRAGARLTKNRLLAFAYIDECLSVHGDDDIVRWAYQLAAGWEVFHFAPFAGRGIDHIRGDLALRLGLTEEAEGWYNTGLEWSTREGCPSEVGRCLHGLAKIAAGRGDPRKAFALLDEAAHVLEKHGLKLYLDRVLAAREEMLQGKAVSGHIEARADGLTTREVEVLRLVAQGMSSREIGEALVLSVRTVDRHIANMYRKIDVSGRAQAVRYALDHGLTWHPAFASSAGRMTVT